MVRQGLPVRRNLRVEQFACVLRAPRFPRRIPVLCRGTLCAGTPPFERLLPLYPRGPRSSPGYSVLVHPHLLAPCAPLAGTSRLRRRAVYTRCLRCASYPRRLGDPRVVPCFRWTFCIDMSPSETPRSSSTACTQFYVDDAGLRLLGIVSALPTPFTLRFP